jgi:tripartite-type tricarboxylate transporter receptor subunit TctC
MLKQQEGTHARRNSGARHRRAHRLSAAPAPAAAQAADAAAAARYPDRPVRMVVPFAPAGTADIVARLVAQRMAPGLGQPVVVVENRAGGTVCSKAVAKAARTACTLALHAVFSAVLNSFFYRRLPYDARRDFVAGSQVGQSPNVLVVQPGLPANSVWELIALLKREPAATATAPPATAPSCTFRPRCSPPWPGWRPPASPTEARGRP